MIFTNDLFYLVKRGTNFRVMTIDKEPLVVEEEAIDDEIENYEKFLRLEVGALEPMTVKAYYERYVWPQLQIKAGMKVKAAQAARGEVREDDTEAQPPCD